MSNLHEPIFVNIIGHTAGAIIFGIFLVLFLRDRARRRGSWLSAAAAGLAFLWNFGSLAVLLAIQIRSPASSYLIAASFAVSAFSLRCCYIFHLRSRCRP